jgi:hypothetical protein
MSCRVYQLNRPCPPPQFTDDMPHFPAAELKDLCEVAQLEAAGGSPGRKVQCQSKSVVANISTAFVAVPRTRSAQDRVPRGMFDSGQGAHRPPSLKLRRTKPMSSAGCSRCLGTNESLSGRRSWPFSAISAQDEFVLTAIAQNLRRLASLVARPPPAQALCIA